jgi:peptidoglycan/xylan/chitin deacetylase (PgdA/CDA1 family)
MDRAGLALGSLRGNLPVIFGSPTYRQVAQSHVDLGIDVFGSAFFLLARYEEAVISTRDHLDRFPAGASIATRHGFLDRPIIDEYVELLWSALVRLVPGLMRRTSRFRIAPSHDVDEPSRDAFRGLRAVLKESAGDLLKRHRVRRAMQGPWHWLRGQIALHPRDAYNTFDRLMDLSESQGTKSTFFFMSGASNPEYDCAYRLEHPAIRRLLRRIHDRGHEIGLHPSFETFRDSGLLSQEADQLRDMLRRIGVRQSRLGARMHYLRWSLPETWRAMVRAGIDYDASLGFADMAGFRCGTCHRYRAFDVQSGQPLDLLVRPLIAMDVTVMDEQYMGLGTSPQAHELLGLLRDRCESVGGEFSLLWHNNEFIRPGSWNLYQRALGAES